MNGFDFSLSACREIINDTIESGCNVKFDPVAIGCDYCEDNFDTIKEIYCNHPDIVCCESVDELISALNEHTLARLLSNGNILYRPF